MGLDGIKDDEVAQDSLKKKSSGFNYEIGDDEEVDDDWDSNNVERIEFSDTAMDSYIDADEEDDDWDSETDGNLAGDGTKSEGSSGPPEPPDNVVHIDEGNYKNSLTNEKIQEILNIEKGQRPLPETYMTQEDIDKHLDLFNDGGSFVMTKDQYELYVEGNEYIGMPDNTQFITTKQHMDSIADEASGNIAVYEKKLGFEEGHFSEGGGLVRIDVNDPKKLNARIPSGNEMGANEHFVPGGYTDGGSPECVVDKIPNDDDYRQITMLKKEEDYDS